MPQSRHRTSAPAWTRARVQAAALVLIATCLLPALAAAAAPEQAVIHHVNNAAAGANDGTSWADAFVDLQSALDAAVAGDQIWVAASATPYTPTATINGSTNPRLASFALKSGVAIHGGFAGDEKKLHRRVLVPGSTVLSGDIGVAGDDADNSYHVVHADGVTGAVLDGFTITGGRSYYQGGGLYTHESLLTVTRCVFSDNSALVSGGGMYSQDSTLTVSDCLFSGNRAGSKVRTDIWARGGGMYNEGNYPGSDASSVITGCTFRDNGTINFSSCDFRRCGGGGMYNDQASVTIDRSSFEQNWARGYYSSGGGLVNYGSWSTITNSVFTGNTTNGYGGAMANFGSAFVLNCTFYRNGKLTLPDGLTLSPATGGAILQWDGPARIIGSLFSGNRASGPGGGITASHHHRHEIEITKSLFHENREGCWKDGPNCVLGHLEFTSNFNFPKLDGLLFDVDPLLADPENGDFHLLPGSPAIDAGVSRPDLRVTPTPLFPAQDFEGNQRIVDGGGLAGAAADIGADEYVPTLEDLDALIQELAAAGQLDEALTATGLTYVADVQTALDDGDLDAATFILDELIAWLTSLDVSETTQRMLRLAEAVLDSVG